MTDEIEIPDPLGEENKNKKKQEAPVEPPADATVINLPPAAPAEEPVPVPPAPVEEEPVVVPPTPVVEEPVLAAEPEVVVMPDMAEVPSPVIETPAGASYTAPSPAYASPAAPAKKDNTIWWILGVALLLILCCCCAGIVTLLWFTGDFLIEALNSMSAIILPLLAV